MQITCHYNARFVALYPITARLLSCGMMLFIPMNTSELLLGEAFLPMIVKTDAGIRRLSHNSNTDKTWIDPSERLGQRLYPANLGHLFRSSIHLDEGPLTLCGPPNC